VDAAASHDDHMLNAEKLEIDGKAVENASAQTQARTHAQTDGQPEDIMAPTGYDTI